MTTDFKSSFAVFIYRCGDLNFPRNHATIGFVSEDGVYANHEAMFRKKISAVSCLNYPNSPWVNVVYDIAVPGKSLNYQISILDYMYVYYIIRT